LTWVATLSALHAETVPVRGMLDPRVRVAVYQPEQVYRLTGFVGYHIHVQWEPGETFVGLGAGDMEGLSFVAQGSHLFLKPKVAQVATNLTVITDRRQYLFEYSAEARRPNPVVDDVVYSLTFTYGPPPSGKTDGLEAALAAPALRRNLNYGFCGSRALKPVSVYDDGLHLHVRFPARADWPAVFVRNPDGTDALVNFTVEKDELVVHKVAERFILRRGKLVGCLINRAFDASGVRSGTERSGTGTVSPDVVRRSIGVTP
jgi:type IV secretion system protein VirB9